MTKPTWDLLIIGADENPDDYAWFPVQWIRDNRNLIVFEGIRFRDVYLTSRAIETGSASLFQILYRTALMMRGSVRHINDYDFGAYE